MTSKQRLQFVGCALFLVFLMWTWSGIHFSTPPCEASNDQSILNWKGCFKRTMLLKELPRRTVDLSQNGLVRLPYGFIGWTNDQIHTLYLSDNEFEELPDLSTLKTLRMLSLRRNKLKRVNCDMLPDGIAHLILTDNHVDSFVGDCQSKFQHLNKLMMARNHMEVFPADLVFPALELIRLPQNRLKQLPRNLLTTSPKLKWASLAENPCCPEPELTLPDLGTLQCASQKELGSGTSGVAVLCEDKSLVFKRFKSSSTDGSWQAELRISSLLPRNNPAILAPVGTAYLVSPLGSNEARSFGVVFSHKDALPIGLPPTFMSEDRFPPNKQHRFTAERVLDAMNQVACALSQMHQSGVAHMDLYAHNTLLSEKDVVILDFGAATCIKFLEKDDAALFIALDVRAFGNLIGNLIDHVVSDASTDVASMKSLRKLKQLADKGIDSTQLCKAATN